MDVIFVRNGPILLSYNSKISEVEKREIANELSDVNLVFARNIEPKTPIAPGLSIAFCLHLFEELSKKDFYKISHIISEAAEKAYYKVDDDSYKYIGSSVSCILYNYNYRETSNIFLCEKTNFHKEILLDKKVELNKKKLLVRFDSKEDMQAIQRFINPMLTEEVDELLKSEKAANNSIFHLQEVLTPLNLKYLDKEYTIGFLFSSGKFGGNILILNLSKDILKNRELFVKLFIHLFNLFVEIGRDMRDFLEEDDGDCVYLDLRNRKHHKLKGEKIELQIENLDVVFNNITMGIEGEFCFLSKDENGTYKTVEANKVIANYLIFMNRYKEVDKLLENYLGVDEEKVIGKFRTKAYKIEEDTYKKMVEEIESILSEIKLCAKLNDCEITYASEECPTGTHFHVSIPDFSKFNFKEQNIIAKNFILLLDIVLSSFLETLNTGIRFDTGYHHKNNYRIKPHGFEYRTPPSVIFYYDLYKYIFKIFHQIAVDYFKNKYVSLEMENINKLSIEFYKKHIGEDVEKFSEMVCKLRDLVNKAYLLTVNKTDVYVYEYKKRRFFEESKFDDAELQNIIIDLNINYAKDSRVKIYVSRNLEGYAKSLEESIFMVGTYKFTGNTVIVWEHLQSENPILRDYCIYEVYVRADFKNRDYFKEVLYDVLKEMEQRGNLVASVDEIIEKLMKRHGVLK